MSTALRLALRNLLRHPWRSLATILGIGIGIAAVITTLSVGANVEANLRRSLQEAAGKADLLITPGALGLSIFETEPLLARVREQPGTLTAFPVLNTRAEPERSRDEQAPAATSIIPGVDSGFQVQGRVTEEPDAVPGRLSSGAYPQPGERGIAIADGFAEGRGIRVGQEVEFVFSSGRERLRVTGLLDDAVGIASTNGGRVGLMALKDLQEVLHLTGRASHIEVQAISATNVDQLQAALESVAGEGFAVTYPAGSGSFTFGIVQTLQAGLSVLAATLLALGGFLAYNTFMASVVERRREYALLRTVAMTRRGVMWLSLYEALALALFGVIAGVLLGVLLSYLITYLNSLTFGFDFRTLTFPLSNVLLAGAFGVGASLIAGLLPALAAARTAPMQAMRRAAVTEPPPRTRPGLLITALGAGLALAPWKGTAAIYAATISLALLFLGVALFAPALITPAARLLARPLTRALGPAGRLGAAFAERNRSRNGVATSTVMVGAGLVIGVGSMVASTNEAITSWIDTTVVGDLFVTAPVPFPDDFESRAQGLPGIDVVSGVKITAVRLMTSESDRRGRSIALVLVDPERFHPETGFGRFQYMPGEGDSVSTYAALKAGEVLVANTLKDRYGIATGGSVTLRTTEGFREFSVSGVVVDFTGGGETVVASIDLLESFGGGNPDLFVVTLEPGVEQEAARQALLTTFPDLSLDVTKNADYKRFLEEITSQAFSTTRLLLLIAVIVAALAVANTLGMNLVNRGHEIAVLRTIGLTRRGVGALVTAEGVLVTVLGAALGVLFGLLLSRVITAGAAALTGFALTPTVPLGLIGLALLASPLIGIIAALLPARRAARTPPSLSLATWSEHA